MISEILKQERIILSEDGDYSSALSEFTRFLDPEFQSIVQDTLSWEKIYPHSLSIPDVLIPHARIAGIHSPEIMLAVSEKGFRADGRTVHLILFFITPEADTARHLQLLQGLASLAPELAEAVKQSGRAESPEDYQKKLHSIVSSVEKNLKPTYRNLTQEQVAFELHTDLSKGLSSEEAAKRLSHYGYNHIASQKKTPWYFRLFKNLFSFFSLLLWVAAALCFIPGVDMPQLGIAVIIVILVNGIFAFVQEYKSDRAVESLQKLITPACRVIRDGRQTEVKSSELVPGDLIVLEEGDIVPADARLTEAFEVEVDNSSLTGESTSAKRYKSDRPEVMTGKFLWIELPNILFAGSVLVKGQAKALVFGTGMNSEIGKIAGLTQTIRTEKSPLEKQLESTVYSIALLAFSIGIMLLLLGWQVAGLHFAQAFIFFIGVFVANVPEGLLPTVTLSLAMGVTRMAKRNALVKNLSAVETLGCTTVICCDKTGTLTQNLQMVERIITDGKTIMVTGHGYETKGELLLSGEPLKREQISEWAPLRHLLECSLICNNSRLEGNRVLGDPTEGALLVLAGRAGVKGGHHRIHVNPFESVRKRMSVVVRAHGGGRKISYMKGAMNEVLSGCTHTAEGSLVRELTEADRERIRRENDTLAEQGMRILALAWREDEELQSLNSYNVETVEKNHIFAGLTAMTDPLRPEVPDAIAKCHTAGIRVIMITGDYPLTAASIARKAGIGKESGQLKVISGGDLSGMSEDDLKSILKEGESIFARVSPDQKLRIVTALKELDEIVAVTGDGVNDGPALKKADIGVAMGLRGTDVARESAQMILTDDNFASIVAAIEEGRAVFQNIKKFSSYVFNSNPQELYPYILWMLIPGFPLAMTVMGVLAVDVGTDLIPAMGLGAEPPEKGIMEKPPRRRDEKILSLKFILENYFVEGSVLAFASFATLYYFGWAAGYMENGFSFTGLPASPDGLNMNFATQDYLMALTAYFFPTVTTQVANVMVKRSGITSLFARDFLNEAQRAAVIEKWRSYAPQKKPVSVNIKYYIESINQAESVNAFAALLFQTLLFPLKLLRLASAEAAAALYRPVLRPLSRFMAGFLEKNYILVNLFSNPLINAGIAFELGLAFLFFYTDLSDVYFFEPVPWHVYLFAFHGTVLLIVFSEIKKFFLRRKEKAAV